MKTRIFQLDERDADIVQQIWNQYIETGLRFGWKSNRQKSYDFGHWNQVIAQGSKILLADQTNLPFLKRHPLIEHIWKQVNQTLGGNRALLRVYVNGYTYGTDAYAHKDDTWIIERFGPNTLSETIIVYLNEYWDKDWAGETVIFTDEEEIDFAVLPRFGRVLAFNSRKWHAARPLTRACPELRAVLVFKTTDPRVLSPELQFLYEKTKDIPHSGKSFFEHLYNTFLILEEKEAPKEVCIAGLFHSIYGTEFFPRVIVQKSDRAFLRKMIGEYPERLVYEFCSLSDRFISLLENRPNYDPKMHRDLLMIACANLIEQSDHRSYNQKIAQLVTVLEELL